MTEGGHTYAATDAQRSQDPSHARDEKTSNGTKTVTLLFARERETLNNIRFYESTRRGLMAPERVRRDQDIVGPLYVSKRAVARLGDPDLLYVTITVACDG
jgi:hypothetical protein